ncbi:MAG TPA: hypothetical protein VMD30_06735, partial [Tepidisphaeraceae bacterium]|nr:hypothetical protein [Tepidisphaeraceae bacterium]
PAVGLWAAAIMALAQPQIIESQDARPYELAVTLCIAAWDILIRIEKDNGTSRWLFITLAVTVLAAALSHYFAAGVLAAILLYAAIRFYGAKLRATFAAIAAATVAGIVLWGHGFIEQANQPMFNGNWMYWFNDAGPGHVTRTFFRFAALPVRYLAEPTPGSIKLVAAGSVLYLLPFLVLRKRPQLLACALWLICGAGVVMMLDLFRQGKQLDFIKYTLLAAPAVYLMLPMLLKSPHLLGALGVICAAVAIPAAQRDTVDWRPLAKRVATIPTDQPLMIDGTQWGDWYGPILFMAVQRYTPSLPRTIVIVRQPALRPQWIARWQQKQMWILSSPDLAWVSKLLQHRNGQLVWRDSDMELFEIFPISQISAGLKTPTH